MEELVLVDDEMVWEDRNGDEWGWDGYMVEGRGKEFLVGKDREWGRRGC